MPPQTAPATLPDRPGPPTTGAVDPRAPARAPESAASSPAVVVAAERAVTIGPALRPDDEVVAALVRLRETLLATGRSLDRVAATVPTAGAPRPSSS